MSGMRIGKRIVVCLTAVLLGTGQMGVPAAPAAAAGNALYVNGYCLPEVQTRTVDGNLLFPVFETLRPLGCTVTSVSGGSQVEILHQKRGLTVTVLTGTPAAVVNGAEISVSAAMYFYQGALWAPVDFLEKAMGFFVETDAGCVRVYTQPREVLAALSAVDALCGRETLDFMLSLYDPDSGGFYYCPSARDHVQFGTNLESTNQALNFLQTGGAAGLNGNIRDLIPAQAQGRLLTAVKLAQDPEDGYFYNSWQGKQVGRAKRERDLTAAVSILKRFGAEPLYPLPAERLSEAEAVNLAGVNDHLASEESFLRWLDALNWNDPYSAGSLIAASVNTIGAAGLLDTACAYLSARQNRDTGLWGEGETYDAANAAMKIGAVYAAAMVPYPNMEKAADSVIRTVTGPDQPETICEVWNPLEALNYMYAACGYQVPELVRTKLKACILDLIRVTEANMQLFRKPDGGVSYYRGFGQAETHGSPAGLGLAEGDVDATYIGTLQIRRSLYQLADFSFMPPLYSAYGGLVTGAMTGQPAEAAPPGLMAVRFRRGDGAPVTEIEPGLITPVCRMKGEPGQCVWLFTALYSDDRLISVRRDIASLANGVQEIEAPAVEAGAGQTVKVMAMTEALVPCGSPGILDSRDGKKEIVCGNAVVAGRSFPIYSNPEEQTLTVYLPLEAEVKAGMLRCGISLTGTGRIEPVQGGAEQNLANRTAAYRVTAENGSYDTYTLRAVMTEVQRAYDFDGAELLASDHSVPQRRRAFSYLSGGGNQGWGMWYNAGFVFDETGALVRERSFGTIGLAAGRTGGGGVLDKNRTGGELGVVSLGGDPELAGSAYRYLCRFAVCVDWAEPGAALWFGSGGARQFCLRAAEDGKKLDLTCGAAPAMISRIETGVWHEVAYVWSKGTDACRMEWYLDGRFAGAGVVSVREDGSLRSGDTAQGRPPYQFSLLMESDALAVVRLDDFYLSAARDTL